VPHLAGETRLPILLVHIGQSDVDNLSVTTAGPVAGAAVAGSTSDLGCIDYIEWYTNRRRGSG